MFAACVYIHNYTYVPDQPLQLLLEAWTITGHSHSIFLSLSLARARALSLWSLDSIGDVGNQ